ncbi:MAG: SpaA isopeptide-forming pilin-related protein, partial [Angelakisella sp.]
SFGSLPYGNYQFQQTSAKTGYTAVGTPVPVTISSATPVQENLANTPAAVGTLQIDKFSLNYPDWKLAGGKFKLMDSAGKTMLALSPASDASGVITLSNLMSIVGTPQSYKIVEQVAPTGYDVNTQEITSQITVNTTTTTSVPNTPTASGAIDIDLTDTNYSAYGLDNSDYDLYVEVV